MDFQDQPRQPPLPPQKKKPGFFKRMWDLLTSLFLFYAVVVVCAYFFQSYLIYHPDRNPPGHPRLYHLGEQVLEMNVVTEDNVALFGWWTNPHRKSKPAIVYFHGNGGNRGIRSKTIYPFMQQDYGVLLTEYRGYAGNNGTPSEEGLYKDARAFMDWLLKTQKYRERDIILYGESLGAGVALQMATEYPGIRALILEAPFTTLLDLGEYHYPWLPVKYLLKEKYDNLSKIQNVQVPVLFLHGTADQVVPLQYGKTLYDAANYPKTWLQFEGAGHNNIYDYGAHEKVLDFLREVSPSRFR